MSVSPLLCSHLLGYHYNATHNSQRPTLYLVTFVHILYGRQDNSQKEATLTTHK